MHHFVPKPRKFPRQQVPHFLNRTPTKRRHREEGALDDGDFHSVDPFGDWFDHSWIIRRPGRGPSLPDGPRRISRNDRVIGNIARYHRARSHDRSAADPHSRHDEGPVRR